MSEADEYLAAAGDYGSEHMALDPEPDAGETQILEEELAIRDRLRVDPSSLDDDLARCAGDIAYAGSRQARATLQQGRAKIRAKKTRAIVYLQCKETATDTYGARGATVDVINALVDQDPRYLAAAEDEVVADATLTVAKTNVQAALARKDMVVQVASSLRAEIARDGYVVERPKRA